MFTCNVLSSYATSSHSPEQLQQNKEKCVCGKSVLSNRVDENHVPRCSILGSVQYCRMLKRLLKSMDVSIIVILRKLVKKEKSPGSGFVDAACMLLVFKCNFEKTFLP